MQTTTDLGCKLIALASVAALLQGGSCVPDPNPGPAQPGPAFSDYSKALDAYSSELSSNFSGQPQVAVVAIERYGGEPIGTVFVGTNPSNTCSIPASALPDPVNGGRSLGYVPPAGNKFSFDLGASVPPQLTGGIVNISAEVSHGKTVSMGFSGLKRFEVLDDAFTGAIDSPACRDLIRSRGVTVVRGYVTGLESFQWSNGTTVNANANIASIKDGPGFKVGFDAGGNPVSYAETSTSGKPDPIHFLILYTIPPTATATSPTGAPAAPAPSGPGQVRAPEPVVEAIKDYYQR